MAINPSSLSARGISENTDSTVEFLSVRPPAPDQAIETALPAGKLYAYYESVTDSISLYVVSSSGLRFLPV